MRALLLRTSRDRSVQTMHAAIMPALALALILFNLPPASAQTRQRRQAAASTSTRALTIRTEPNAIIWLDDVRRGAADATGQLKLEKIAPGRHSLRVRAVGFKERALALLPAQRGSLDVKLTPTTDEAELLFQKAEEARERARDDESRGAAAELYRQALAERPRYPQARVGLARTLLEMNKYNAALDELDRAREVRPIYAEASAVEGRILRQNADNEGAITAFRRSIREARGFQPEAHTGLALVYEELNRNEEAAAEFRTALAQLSDSEPVIYQLLGALYEKMEKYKEAVAAYEKYLELAPEGNLAPAVRSIIDQLRRQAAEQESPSN